MTIHLPEQIRQAILVHAENCRPNECCGLIASDAEHQLRFAYPITNVNPSPVSYTIDPNEHFAALSHAESQGWHLSGVFHSHPTGPASPSVVDVRAALDPGWIYLIVSPDEIRAFAIRAGTVNEIATT